MARSASDDAAGKMKRFSITWYKGLDKTHLPKIEKNENRKYFIFQFFKCSLYIFSSCTLLTLTIIYIYANNALKILCKIETNNSYLYSVTN